MTKGIVTIATGKTYYYKLAATLLKSYRLFSSEPLPFAIIAEEENEYTALFDEAVIVKECFHSFLDKFLLLKYSPFDECIFFDSDSLAFGDLNEYWRCFQNATDFSAVGVDMALDKSMDEGAWYMPDGIWKYADAISYKCRIHSGVCFIRSSDKTSKMFEDCLDIYQNFDKLNVRYSPDITDEVIFDIAMPMNDMRATKEETDLLGAYPCLTKVKANPLFGKASYSTTWGLSTDNGILIHFGTANTKIPFYQFCSEIINHFYDTNRDLHGKLSLSETILYKYQFRLLVLDFHSGINKLSAGFRRFLRRIKKHFVK